MRELLKLAFHRGHEQGIRNAVPEQEYALVKEALSWQAARNFFSPVAGAASGVVKRVMSGTIPGKISPQVSRLVARKGSEAAMAGAGGTAMRRHLLRTGAGAGIGAIAGGEEGRGRGALMGAMGGLGLGLGARMGGGKAFEKTLGHIGGKASTMIRRGKLAPTQEAVSKFMRQQAFSAQGPWKHRVARQMLGAGVLGAGGLAGGVMAGKALTAPSESPASGQMFGATPAGYYGQALGVTPGQYQEQYYPQEQY